MASIPVYPQALPSALDHWPPASRPRVQVARVDAFREKLPLTARIVDARWWILPMAVFVSIVTGSLSDFPSLGWSPMLAWAILAAIAADRPFHALTLVGPTTFAALVLFLKFGVGLPLAESAGMAVAREASFNCGCFAFTLISTLLLLLRVIGPCGRQDFGIAEHIRLSERDLGRVGLAVFGYALVLDAVLIVTGGLDRSLSTDKAYGYGEMGWWSWFALFQDITNIGLFVLPLAVRRWPLPARYAVYGVVFARAILCILSGTRSLALFPLFSSSWGVPHSRAMSRNASRSTHSWWPHASIL